MAAELTKLLRNWREGDRLAADRLLELTYPELCRLARSCLRREAGAPVTPSELVHEAFLRLAGSQQPDWQSRAHFYSIAARLMRQILVDLARESQAEKRGAGFRLVPLKDSIVLSERSVADLMALDQALIALAQFDERKSRILELRFFGGLTTPEIAGALQMSESSIARHLRAAEAWLRARLSSVTPHDTP